MNNASSYIGKRHLSNIKILIKNTRTDGPMVSRDI